MQASIKEQISTAITTYDDAVAGLNKTFKDVESAQKQAVENASDLAWWQKKTTDLAVTLNPMLHVSARLGSSAISAILEGSQAAMKSYRASVETTAAQALADARRDWTGSGTAGGVAAKKEQLVQALGAATRTAVDSMADNERAFIDAVALAEKTFIYGLAGTHSTYELARSAAQQTAEHAWADSDELASQDYAAADAAEEVARAEAKKNYDIARANLYAADMSAWAAAEGTHYADYIDALAAADAAWTAAVAPARVAYVTSTTTADVAWSDAIAAADKDWAHCQADAERARVVAMEPAGKLAQEKTADAAQAQANGNSLATMTFRKAAIAADETYNNTMAAAERLLAEQNAVAGHSFVYAAIPHKVDQFLNDLTDAEYNAAVSSALQTYTDALHANNNTRQTSIADALVAWTGDVAAAEKALQIASATAARDFAVDMQAATDAFAGSKKTAEDAETAALAGGRSSRVTAAATAYANWVTAATAADTTFVAAAGAASVTWNTATATAEGDYHVAMADDAAAAADAWATAEGTAEARFYADTVGAHAAWLADVAPDYVTYRTDTATAESDYDDQVAAADAAQANSEEAASLAYYTTLAPAYATRKTTIGAADTELEKSTVIKGNAHMVAVANANLTSVTTTAAAQEAHANAMATAKRDYDVAMLTNTGSSEPLEDARDQAEADSLLAVKTAEADARLAWTTSVSAADEAYATGVATATHTHAVAVATAKESYADTYSTARSTWYQATVAADVAHAKAVADAEYDLTVASAQAFSDAQVAQYQARATAMLVFVSYDLPWVDFQIALASHESAWASSIAPAYVAFESAVAGAEKTYVYAEADAYSVCETAIDTALATFDTTMNTAWLTSATAQADAQKASVVAMAPLQKAYDCAQAQAKRDHDVAVATAARDLVYGTIDQAQHDSDVAAAGTARSSALETAMGTYRTGASGAERTRLVSLADASKTYDIAHADASLLYTTTAAGAIETYVITISDAGAACETTIADETCDYWILATDSYADEMAFLAGTSPWGQQYYDAARAEADRVALVAPAERDRQIAAAEAARDHAQDEAAAKKAKVVDEATAGHDQAVAVANAEHTRAVAEADALAADADYAPPRLVTPASGGAQIVSAGLALNGEPANFARNSGFSDLFNSIADGWMGDGYFMGIVSSMFYVAPARDELGYTNGFQRFLGENLIRPVVGDQALINATDTQLLLGTAAVCAAPFLIAAAPAAIAAAPWLFAGTVLVGAALGGAYNVAAQLDAGVSWSEIDWWSVGTSALVGGVMGAACFVAMPYLAAAIPGFCTVASLAGFGLSCYSVYNGINNMQDGNYYTGTLDLIVGFTGIYGAARGWYSRASRAVGGSCFVLGTQVVRHAVAAQLAATSHTTEDASSGWDPKLLGLAAGTFLAGLFLAPDLAERRRRREEAERARRLMFERSRGGDPWQDDWDDVVDDAAPPGPSAPDRWESEIDRLCDALFNGPVEEPGVEAEFEPTFEEGFEGAFEPALEESLEARSEPNSDPAAGTSSPVATRSEPEHAVALKAPPARLEPKPSFATCRSRDPAPPTPKPPPRRTLRWLAAAACLLLSGLLLFKASPSNVLSPGGPSPSATAVAPADSQPKYVTSNIEDIRVGDRVLGRNPELTDAERTTADPDPATWRRLELRAPKVDGTWADVVLLRPLSWLEERGVNVGGTVHISVPECSIRGNAEVLVVGECPPIEPGTGPVVTGTFRHASGRVIDVHVEGLDEPIGTTANHPFWSEDRREFVRADELQTNERLRILGGTVRVTALIPRPQPQEVYNLEVQAEHVYHVGTAGILVHNGSPLWCPKSLRWRDSSTGRYTTAPPNQKVSRYWGGKSPPNGHSWTRDPVNLHSRERLGLGRSNTARFRSHGTIIDDTNLSARRAKPWGGFRGGGDELLIPDPEVQVRLDALTMPDPPLPDY